MDERIDSKAIEELTAQIIASGKPLDEWITVEITPPIILEACPPMPDPPIVEWDGLYVYVRQPITSMNQHVLGVNRCQFKQLKSTDLSPLTEQH